MSRGIVKRLARLVGHAPYERSPEHDERAASADLGYSPMSVRDCLATVRVPPEDTTEAHPGPSTNFLRAYLSGAYDPLAPDGEEDSNDRA